MTYQPRAKILLDVPQFGSIGDDAKFTTLSPTIIECTFTRNNHLRADEFSVTIPWEESGVDPRMIKNARCSFWLWDANHEDFDLVRHLRFTGICKSAERKLSGDDWACELSFHDYTTLFINNKPMRTDGLPYYTDDLKAVWERICDNTGWLNPEKKQIVSSVKALRNHLVFFSDDPAARNLGEIVTPRFRKIARPSPKKDASSWDVWQWCVSALGLISYIEKDECIVKTTTEHFNEDNSPQVFFGQNIYSLEEKTDNGITRKGILLKSLNVVTGQLMEAFYPPPGDARLKIPRAAVRPKSEEGSVVTQNEVSEDYEEFERHDIQDQTALDRAAEEAYEERKRQELQGSFRTMEMRIMGVDGNEVDILNLRAGDPITIQIEQDYRKDLIALEGGNTARVRYLVDRLGYDEEVAKLIVLNLNADAIASAVFHVKEVTVGLGPDTFNVDVRFHNLINVSQ